MEGQKLLTVKDLKTYFYTSGGVSKAVDGVSFEVEKGEILGIVGESGSGKSVTSSSIIHLLPAKTGKIVGGSIDFNGTDVLKLSQKELLEFRGKDISMIFQNPMTSLSPVFKVGMCQRVIIAMSVCSKPQMIIADEPTTALDVTVQAQVLDLLKELRDKYGTAILLITHNLGVVWDMCDSVIVMYAGKTVEYAPCIDLYNHPLHPYTWGLLDCMPRLSSNSKEELSTIAGTPPDLRLTGVGCNFANRCPYAQERCRTEVPELTEVSPGHRVACHRQTGGNRLVRNEVTESGR